LSDSQKDKLAQAITKVHTSRFTTPSLFVNVRFIDVQNESYYVGGKLHRTNRVKALVRAGGGRSQQGFDQLAREVKEAWDNVLLETDAADGKATNHSGDISGPRVAIPAGDERELKVVFITGTILAGVENGFTLPPAGGDVEWLKSNLVEFERLADEGHQDFIDLVAEIRSREDLKSVV